MYINSVAVTELLRYSEIVGIPIKLFLISTWQYKRRILIVFKWLAVLFYQIKDLLLLLCTLLSFKCIMLKQIQQYMSFHC